MCNKLHSPSRCHWSSNSKPLVFMSTPTVMSELTRILHIVVVFRSSSIFGGYPRKRMSFTRIISLTSTMEALEDYLEQFIANPNSTTHSRHSQSKFTKICRAKQYSLHQNLIIDFPWTMAMKLLPPLLLIEKKRPGYRYSFSFFFSAEIENLKQNLLYIL